MDDEDPPPYIDEQDRGSAFSIPSDMTQEQFLGHMADLAEQNHGPPGPPKECFFCGELTESPPPMCAFVNGRTIDDIALCGCCRRLMYDDSVAFWAKFREKLGN